MGSVVMCLSCLVVGGTVVCLSYLAMEDVVMSSFSLQSFAIIVYSLDYSICSLLYPAYPVCLVALNTLLKLLLQTVKSTICKF